MRIMLSTPAWIGPALSLIRRFEGCRLDAYPDPLSGGAPWTIGWGCTRIGGKPVTRGQRISQQAADQALLQQLSGLQQHLAVRVPGWAKLNGNQAAALLSFSWNVGPDWFGSDGFATLSRCFSTGNLSAVPGALGLYVNPGTSVEAGLRKRRQAEVSVWLARP